VRDSEGLEVTLVLQLVVRGGLIADVDFNGNVGFDDFMLSADHFGLDQDNEDFDAVCDLNEDGRVDLADFFIFADQLGKSSTATKLVGEGRAKESVYGYALEQEYGLTEEMISEHEGVMPATFSLWQNYPNPFNPTTTISYLLAQDEEVTLSIWNLSGQLVRELVHEVQPDGSYSATWDGRDGAGKLVANGVYLYQIRAGDFRSARKMVLMK